MYTQEYLKTTLEILKSQIADLSMWSAYNDDKFNEEISKLKKILASMTESTSL